MTIRTVGFTALHHALGQRYGDAQGLKGHRAALVVRIETADGLVGWGDISNFRGDANVAHLREAREMLVGRDALAAARLVDRLRVLGPRVAAGVDIALADIRGQAAGMNLATLFGGAYRDRQPCYASLQNANEAVDVEADAVAQAMRAVGMGFRHVKMKVGWHAPDVDSRWVNAVLAALPDGVSLAIDANRVLDLADAARLIRGIRAPERIAWFEEPLGNRHPRAYGELRARLAVPIAGGESMPVAMLEEVIAGRMMDIVQPDLVGHGGFAVMRHLLALCDAHGVRLVPHCFDGQLMRVATLHLLAARPDWEERHGPYGAAPVEVDISANPLRDRILREAILPDGKGMLAVPAGPGLGVTVDEDFLAASGQVIAA